MAQDARAFAGQTVIFTVSATGGNPFDYQWYRGAEPIAGATGPVLRLEPVSVAQAGAYRVSISNAGGYVQSAPVLLEVLPQEEAPRFVAVSSQEISLKRGEALVLAPQLSGAAPESFQWYKNGEALADQTSPTLTLGAADFDDAGVYVLEAVRRGISVKSGEYVVRFPLTSSVRFANLSIRTLIGPDLQAAVIGLVSTGAFKSPILLRGSGPSLGAFGVTPFASDPLLVVYSGETPEATNDNWAQNEQPAALAALFRRVGAFDFVRADSTDSALQIEFAGARTVQLLAGENSTEGTSLFEAYDVLKSEGSELINLSALARAGSDSKALMLGFSIEGSGKAQFLLRGIGPGLKDFGISDFARNPRIRLQRLSGTQVTDLGSNEDWTDSTALRDATRRAGAFPLMPGSLDACMLIELEAGLYTLSVSDAGGEGRALAEAYLLR